MIKYSVTMGVRLVCILLCLFVRGWWLLICAAGAVVLPYIAVVLANAVDVRTTRVERPGSIVRTGVPDATDAGTAAGSEGDETP
jgi:hypothetical protein